MKWLSLAVLFTVAGSSLHAQNVGVGTTTPLTKLHIFNGPSGNTTPYGPVVIETNTHTYLNLLSPDANETSILFGNPTHAASGGILYNAALTPNGFQFRTNGNITRMQLSSIGDLRIGPDNEGAGATLDVIRGTNSGGTAIFRGTTHISHFNHFTNENTYLRAGKDNGYVILNDIPGGRVGIGTATPGALLGFAAALGKKISLYPGVSGDVGFGVSGNLLQIFSDHSNADVGFGYDQGGTFIEKFRMRGNGALRVNGNAGAAGQVLQSNGDATSPTWVDPKTPQFYQWIQSDGSLTISAGTYPIGNLSGQSITITRTSNIVMSFKIPLINMGNAFGANGEVIVEFKLLNSSGGTVAQTSNREYIANGTTSNPTSTFFILGVPPGTYTTSMVVIKGSGGDDIGTGTAYMGLCCPGYLNLQVIPN